MSVLFPTTGRPERATRCLRGLRDTTRGHDVEVIVAVDGHPADARALIPALRDFDRWVLSYEHKLGGCSAAWNRALKIATGDPIVFAADDLVWSHGWLQEALDVHATLGDAGGLVGFNDGHWDGNDLSTHYLMSRDFIVTVLGGVVAWDFYRHSFNDLETCERAKRAGRYAWAENAHVRHEHWLWGDREKDETDLRRLPDHPADQAIYSEREAAGFPNDFQPVIV